MNTDLNKQAHAVEVPFSRKTKSYHFNNILRINLNEKLDLYHHIIERNAQIHIRSEIYFTRLIFLLILKYIGNHQYNTQ